MVRTSWWIRLLPGRIFRRYFAKVVFPLQVAPLEEKKLWEYAAQRINVSAHPIPTMIILFLSIVLLGSYLGVFGIESVGKRPGRPSGRTSASAGLIFVRTITARTSKSKHPQVPFVSPDPCSPHLFRSSAHLFLQNSSATKLATNVEYNNHQFSQPTI